MTGPTINPSIFREYDIRGVADVDLTDEVVAGIGAAWAEQVRATGTSAPVAIGRDCRLSSPRVANALITSLRGVGLDVIDVGMVPSPLLYFAVKHWELAGGIQVTGSHNPPEYNGLKMLVGTEAIHGAAIVAIRDRVERGAPFSANGAGATLELRDPLPDYLAYCDSVLRRPERPLKVVVDAANGAGGPTAMALYAQLGVEVVPLNVEPDGTFPVHHPDPTIVEHLEYLGAAVREHGADLGIGFDGDADRIGTVDENGEIVWGDRMMVVLARALLRERPGATILGEVKCSSVMYDAIRDAGGEPVMGRVGHSIMKSEMKRLDAPLAGELSGHIFYSDRFGGYDDAAYVGARLMEILGSTDLSYSALLADLPEMHSTPEVRLDCADELKFSVVASIAADLPEGVDVCLVDGVRLTWSYGWGLVRASNTQPALVIRAEARTRDRCLEIRRAIEEMVHAAIPFHETSVSE